MLRVAVTLPDNEMLITRVSDLKTKNFDLLDTNEIDMSKIINIAVSRLMIS
jgi:hypothetical protein